MKTIILCGGYGTRLKEETEFKPKPMVFVGNKPLLWHIMKIYSYYGFNEFIFALGYKADYIKDFFLNQKAFTSDFTLDTSNHKITYHKKNNNDDFKITFVDTGVDTLPGERILMCKKYIPEEDNMFMVTYGDGVSTVNIKELIKFHKKQNTIGTITGVNPRSKYGILQTDGKDKIVGFNEKPILSDWVNGGFMVFNKEAFAYLKKGETEHIMLKTLAKKKELSIYKHSDFWYAIDTYKEYEDLNKIWKESAPWQVWK